eukprot:3154191-Prymnesium_polylepis.1
MPVPNIGDARLEQRVVLLQHRCLRLARLDALEGFAGASAASTSAALTPGRSRWCSCPKACSLLRLAAT